ncbi:hypothetical protein D3C86_1036130 [compost metagenome]
MQARHVDFRANPRQTRVHGGVPGVDQGRARGAKFQLRQTSGLKADPHQAIGLLCRGHAGVRRRNPAGRGQQTRRRGLLVGLRLLPGLGQSSVGGAKLGLCRVDVAPVAVEQGQRQADPDRQGRGVLGLIATHTDRSADVRSRPNALHLDPPFRRLLLGLGDPHGGNRPRARSAPHESPIKQAVGNGRRGRVQHGHRPQPGEPGVAFSQCLISRSAGRGRLALGLKPAHQGFAPLLHQPQHGPCVGQNQRQSFLSKDKATLCRLRLGIDQSQPPGRVQQGQITLEFGGPRLGPSGVHPRATTPP